MANTTSKTTSAPAADGLAPMLALSGAWFDSLMAMNKMQIDAWIALQKSLVAGTQDLYDGWACRFGGGAPIDG